MGRALINKWMNHTSFYMADSELKRERGYGRYNPSAISRPTFYMSQALLQAIEAQAQGEYASRSGFVSGLLGFLLLSPLGQRMRENAERNSRTLAQELEQSLGLLQEQLPMSQIQELATASQRSPVQMLTYLTLLGLQSYEAGQRLNVK
jgi:hypothetical protein